MPPLIYGHRGTRRGAPENSLAAMRLALAQGADGIEIDVRLCGSGEPVVLHDPDLLRVADIADDVAKLSLPELLGSAEHPGLPLASYVVEEALVPRGLWPTLGDAR